MHLYIVSYEGNCSDGIAKGCTEVFSDMKIRPGSMKELLSQITKRYNLESCSIISIFYAGEFDRQEKTTIN